LVANLTGDVALQAEEDAADELRLRLERREPCDVDRDLDERDRAGRPNLRLDREAAEVARDRARELCPLSFSERRIAALLLGNLAGNLKEIDRRDDADDFQLVERRVDLGDRGSRRRERVGELDAGLLQIDRRRRAVLADLALVARGLLALLA